MSAPRTQLFGRLTALVLALGCLPAVAAAQAVEDSPDKVSNDQPSRPLQMPVASSEVKAAFDDFDRFQRRGAWERAAKALYSIPEAQTTRFVDGQDGFIIPVARKRHAVLARLSPEGLAAYRLFYDADAKKLLDGAEGATEQATLEKLSSAYFFTTVGDDAADRLGDLYFERGRFDRAADCWLAVFRERPDSNLSPALLAVKAALALSKAGRHADSQAVRREVTDRFAAEVVTIAGRQAKVVDHLARLGATVEPARSAAPSAEPTPHPAPTLAETVAATWQTRFGASVSAGMTPPEMVQWEANSLSLAVPRVAIEGKTLFANYLGHVFALDLASGKMLWRSASFHNLDIAAMSDQSRLVDPTRYAILAAPGFVWSLGRDLKEMNMQATANLVCRRADNGEVVWRSSDLPDYTGMDLVGLPILAKNTLLIAGKSAMSNNGEDNLPRQFVLAIQAHDGKLLWKTEVGTFREGQRYSYYGMRDTAPQPRLALFAGSVYLDTHVGVLARLDVESGALDWGYGYPTDPIQGQSRFFFSSRMQQESTPLGGPPLATDEGLLIKGAKSDRICVIDPGAMKLIWDRPVAKSARPVGVDARAVYLGGPDLGAIDRQDRKLRWSLPMPSGSEDGEVLVRPDGLWQLTPRGIFEVDPKSGRVRRILRGEDAGAAGGDLILTDHWLLAVSNRTISAYPRGGPAAEQAVGADAATTTSKARGSE